MAATQQELNQQRAQQRAAGRGAHGGNTYLPGGGDGGKGMLGMPDPLDVWGNRDKAQQAKQAELLAQNKADIAAGMANRPGYAGLDDGQGHLNANFQQIAANAGPAAQGQVQMYDVGEMDRRLGGVQQIKGTEIGKLGQVGSGDMYAGATNDLNQLRTNAFSAAPSAWAQAAGQQQDLATRQGMDRLGASTAAGIAQQQNDLAMTGGLEGGARERIGRSAANSQVMGGQDLYSQNQAGKLGIAAQDAQMKQQQQMAMPGMGLQLDAYKSGLQGQNIGNDFARQQYNGNQSMGAQTANQALGMFGTNMWNSQEANDAAAKTNASFQNAAAQNQMNVYNAGNQQQANAANTQNLIGTIQGGNQHDMDVWGQGMQVMGAQATANQMANNQQQGGFISKLFGGMNL